MRARIRVSRIEAVREAFPTAIISNGFDTRWNGGCSDPGCCPQHPGVESDGEPMVSIEIPGISGTSFHRWVVAQDG